MRRRFPSALVAFVAVLVPAGSVAALGSHLSAGAFQRPGTKLTPSDEVSDHLYGGEFGWSVAVSADGKTALVGGPDDSPQPDGQSRIGLSFVGAAWVFTRTGSTWAQQGPKLAPPAGTGVGDFGMSVALSADGNTAVIGEPALDSAWVFTRSGSTWAPQGPKLTPAGGTCYRFGKSVALSADGNTALFGCPADSVPPANLWVGAALVFTRSGSTWTQGARLTPGGKAGAPQFGHSVALSGDGKTALIGGVQDNRARGAAWVFTRSGSAWTQQGKKLTGGGETGRGMFGSSVALSTDGNVALIGGPDDGKTGAVWAFTRSGGHWAQQGGKQSGGAPGSSGREQFGWTVALEGDGAAGIVGDVFDAWPVARSGAIWARQGHQLTGGGWRAALSTDGKTALVGRPSIHSGAGEALVFVAP